MKDMKTKLIVLAVGLLMVCLLPLTANAQAQEWQSTSAMQGSGSTYSSQVNAIGAEGAYQMATTTTTNTYSPGRAHRAKKEGEENPWGDNQDAGDKDPGSPIGDAVLPLMLMAVAFGGVVYFRRRKALNS